MLLYRVPTVCAAVGEGYIQRGGAGIVILLGVTALASVCPQGSRFFRVCKASMLVSIR